MRVIFMGAPEFSVPTLQALVHRQHYVTAVYTRAPKPGGRRGLEIKKTPVHEAAESLGLSVYTPRALRSEQALQLFRGSAADVAVIVAYGIILPKPMLEMPRFGCLNLHASLLPRWRGAAPVQRAIMAGDAETGVDLMRMEEGLDTGPIALREVVPIFPENTAGDLASRLAEVAAGIAVRALAALERGTLEFRDQPDIGVCYAPKINKSEAEIDWNRDANEVRNHIHALSPNPGAFSLLSFEAQLERFRILRAQVVPRNGPPGTILDAKMTVACGSAAVRVLEAQRAGRAALSGRDILRGVPAFIGARFTTARKSSPP
ncbi:MAG: methionyl-tRNA formyltransferase [Hyphomicrobiales bacterium]|nr:methionyl-tRNA formyltransferase [Hyphomicrobiales bacterium]